MTGFLRSQGISVSEMRIGASLRRVNGRHHQARRTATARQLNPVPYRANYFGHKVHIDQNEKLVMFGVTHICAVDGYSGKIVGFITMPVKNCIEIYSHLYRSALSTNVIGRICACRPMVLEYGLWDQIRIDHGKEWHLMLYFQERLAHLRYNCNRAPHLQTTSKLVSHISLYYHLAFNHTCRITVLRECGWKSTAVSIIQLSLVSSR